jgi:hypothetical protein
MVRNLSPQGMYIDSALCHVAHEVAPGNLLTVAFEFPSGRPCKLRAIVIHDDSRGCGVEFLEEPPQALVHLAHAGLSLGEEEDWERGEPLLGSATGIGAHAGYPSYRQVHLRGISGPS